jgi:hypothetical protein
MKITEGPKSLETVPLNAVKSMALPVSTLGYTHLLRVGEFKYNVTILLLYMKLP